MLNMLIVDDEQKIREGIRNSIDWKKYQINICGVASCSSEAFNIIDQYNPQIVILDIKMSESEMDGLELLEIINEKYQTIKVILISAYDDFEYAQKAIELKAFYYLLKPINSDKLLSKVLEAKKAIEQQYQKVKDDQNLNDKLKKYIPILRDSFFIQLAKGKITDPQVINDRADFFGIKLNPLKFIILIIEMKENFYHKTLSEYDLNLFKLAVINTSENLFKEKGYNSYSFNLDDNIGLLICGNEIDKSTVKNISKNLQLWVNKSLGLSLTIALGNIYEGFSSISYSYFEALEALDYKLILGKNEVIDIEDVYNSNTEKSIRNNFEEVLNNNIIKLTNALKLSNSENIESIIDDIMSNFQQAVTIDIKNSGHLLFMLSFSLRKSLVLLDVNIDELLNKEKDLYNELKKLETINDIKIFIKNYLEKAMKQFQNNQNHHNSFWVNKAVEYINENVYSNLSLSEVSKAVYINPNYLSKIFKQTMEKSFIEYVTEIKIGEAKKLLGTTCYKIYEIADLLHYKDVNNFTRVFKKVLGVTPTEYRELL